MAGSKNFPFITTNIVAFFCVSSLIIIQGLEINTKIPDISSYKAPKTTVHRSGSQCWYNVSDGNLPLNAVRVIQDDNKVQYICRSYNHHPGQLIPGKGCQIEWDNFAEPITDYQVLAGCIVEWVSTDMWSLPPKAIIVDPDIPSMALEICRGKLDGDVTIGYVEDLGFCYLLNDTRDVFLERYEVLVLAGKN